MVIIVLIIFIYTINKIKQNKSMLGPSIFLVLYKYFSSRMFLVCLFQFSLWIPDQCLLGDVFYCSTLRRPNPSPLKFWVLGLWVVALFYDHRCAREILRGHLILKVYGGIRGGLQPVVGYYFRATQLHCFTLQQQCRFFSCS